jgi:hypothetical protein
MWQDVSVYQCAKKVYAIYRLLTIFVGRLECLAPYYGYYYFRDVYKFYDDRKVLMNKKIALIMLLLCAGFCGKQLYGMRHRHVAGSSSSSSFYNDDSGTFNQSSTSSSDRGSSSDLSQQIMRLQSRVKGLERSKSYILVPVLCCAVVEGVRWYARSGDKVARAYKMACEVKKELVEYCKSENNPQEQPVVRLMVVKNMKNKLMHAMQFVEQVREKYPHDAARQQASDYVEKVLLNLFSELQQLGDMQRALVVSLADK